MRSLCEHRYRLRNVGLVIFVLVMPISAQAAPARSFFDFEGVVSPQWSSSSLDTSPQGNRTYLGQFQNDTVTLTLTDLEPHALVSLSLDLFIIRTWDGSYPGNPNIFDIRVSGGPTLLRASFNNNVGQAWGQSYPDEYPTVTHPPMTGASEVGVLGYFHPDPAKRNHGQYNAIYELEFEFPHSEPTITLEFSASGLQTTRPHGVSDESWGIDNVDVVIAVPEPATFPLIFMGFAILAGRHTRRKN